MAWTVHYHDAFLPEMEALTEDVQDSLLTSVELLQALGPALGRPHADTLAGSQYANMKELRFRADGGLPLRSIRNAKQSCWWQATKAGWDKSGSTRR